MNSPRWAALRATRDDAILTIVAPGFRDEWSGAKVALAGWLGIPSSAERGMSLEDDEGTTRLVLEEQTTYTVRIRMAGQRFDQAGFGLADVPSAAGADAQESLFRLDTGNLVGITSLTCRSTASDSLVSMPVRIRVRKLGDPDADFEWLVTSIVDAIRGLALTVASPTGLKTARTRRGRSYSYEDFVFLRAIAGDVEKAVARISRNPHRRIIDRSELMDSWMAPALAPGQVTTMVTDSRALASVSRVQQARLLSPSARPLFTRANAHYAPLRIVAARRQVSYDTYENRFVRFAVSSFRHRALTIADAATRVRRASLSRDAKDLASRFAALLRMHPFTEVGDLTAFASTSQVLLREDAYNGLLRLYREFVLTADVVWDRFRTLQENRNVADLYEIWVFLETVRAVAKALGAGVQAGESVDALIRTVPDGLHVNLAEDVRSSVTFRARQGLVTVTYNESHPRSESDPRSRGARGSYSLGLRPDVAITLTRLSEQRRILLDAKYRVDKFSTAILADEGDEPEPSQGDGTFKREDVYKMHTYRDAIGGAFAAVAVYPGSERRLFPASIADFTLRGGVGAVPLGPRNRYDPSRYAAEVGILMDAAWSSMDAS